MARIVPGQLRARNLSRWEWFVEYWRGVPRSVPQLRQSLQMLGMYRDVGWHESVRRGRAVDADGAELPWFSYPAIFWLGSALRGDERVFEYGSGNSTAWLSSRVREVVSVEHDQHWLEVQDRRSLPNVELLHRSCHGDEDRASPPDPYVDALGEFPPGHFDLIVVDGMARNTCMELVIRQLPGSGIVVIDNADRPAYYPGLVALQEAGFGRIDFAGPVVIQGVFGTTSVLSRDMPRGVAAADRHPRFWGF